MMEGSAITISWRILLLMVRVLTVHSIIVTATSHRTSLVIIRLAIPTTTACRRGGRVRDFVLYLEPLRANLIAVHFRNGTFGCFAVIIRNKAKALGFAGVAINVDRGRHDVAVRSKGLG